VHVAWQGMHIERVGAGHGVAASELFVQFESALTESLPVMAATSFTSLWWPSVDTDSVLIRFQLCFRKYFRL
jgi:hypothetical protein